MADVRTTEEILHELEHLRRRVSELEDLEAEPGRAATALRESEERFRALYEDNPSMYFTVGVEGTVLSVNRFGAEQLGYRPADVVGRSVLDVFHEEDREAVQAQLVQCVATPGRIFHWEFRKIRRSGELMWVKEVARAVRGTDGDTVVLIVCEDITERKQGEEARRYKEERFRVLYEDNPSMYFTVDPDGLVLSVNRFGAEQLGYGVEDLVGKPVLGVFHPEDSAAVSSQLETCVQNPGRIFHWEFRKIRRDGSLMWVKEVARAVRDSSGRTVVLIVCEDITERKRTEEALRQAHAEMERRIEERTFELSRTVQQLKQEISKRRQAQEELHESREHFRRLVETVHVIPWEANAGTWDFTYVGPQGVTVLGYPLERWFEPKFWARHIHKDDREHALRTCRRLSRGSTNYEFEYRMIAADGRVVWFNDVVSVVREGGRPRLLRGFMIDITARKQAEEQLEKQRTFLRLVLDISPHFIFAKDREGRYTLANQAVADLFGTTPEELVGKTDDDFSPEAEQAHFFREMDRTVIDRLEERFIPEEPLTDSRGNVRWMQTVKKPFLGEDGRPQVLGSATDITARKRAEEKLRDSEAALRRNQLELRELTRKLLTAHEDERRLLAREMHDDLTQRLAALAIEAGKLEHQMSATGGAVPAKLSEMKEEMVRLSQDVHKLSRQLHPSILDDLGLVDAVQAECTSFSEREEIQVRFEASDVPERLEREVGLCLYRIAQEALRNVAKHSQASEARVSLRGENGHVRLTVADGGSGFDAGEAPGRRGLGLASMEERAKMIQAELMVRSRPGEGTVVEVVAPLGTG